MADAGGQFEVDDRDPVREYSESEETRLTENLAAIVHEIHDGRHNDVPCCCSLVCALHRRFFSGVRDHAGRHRSRDFGSEHLVFGPHRSEHRDLVPSKLDELFSKIGRFLRSFADNESDPDYEEKALWLAIWGHAEFIRIHPFEDGNGRMGRALLDLILVRLGMMPVPVEVPKQEYLEALNYYYQTSDNGIIMALYVRLISEC